MSFPRPSNMSNSLLQMDTLIGLEFTPADTHITPATRNFLTRSNHNFARKNRNIDILTGMPTEASVWSPDEEQTGINLRTGEVETAASLSIQEESTVHTAEKMAKEAASDENGAAESLDPKSQANNHNDEHSGRSSILPLKELANPSDEASLQLLVADTAANGDLFDDRFIIARMGNVEEGNLIRLDDNSATTSPSECIPDLSGPANLNNNHDNTTICHDTQSPAKSMVSQHHTSHIFTIPLPPLATKSGPSYFSPSEIKSAYGLNREREFMAAKMAQEEEVLRGLEYFREKIRMEQAGGTKS